jgi:hypothetical protein
MFTFDWPIWLQKLKTGGRKEPLDLIFHILRVASGVENSNLGRIVCQQRLDNFNGRRLASVTCIFLESIAQDTNLLSNECPMQIGHYSFHESISLKFVDGNNLSPILGHFFKIQCLSKIDKRQDIFLETRPPKAKTSFEKFRAQTGIKPNSCRNLVDISTRTFTDGTDGVDTTDSLSKHRVCNELGQF